MKRNMKMTLSTVVFAGLVIAGSAIGMNHSATSQSPVAALGSHMVSRSVIKVHTDHGVITISGTANSWSEAEDAVFVANSIADFQFANSEILWRISNE
ncbi:MAG: BON domain-containing protein [Terriglobales bacterium]